MREAEPVCVQLLEQRSTAQVEPMASTERQATISSRYELAPCRSSSKQRQPVSPLRWRPDICLVCYSTSRTHNIELLNIMTPKCGLNMVAAERTCLKFGWKPDSRQQNARVLLPVCCPEPVCRMAASRRPQLQSLLSTLSSHASPAPSVPVTEVQAEVRPREPVMPVMIGNDVEV